MSNIDYSSKTLSYFGSGEVPIYKDDKQLQRCGLPGGSGYLEQTSHRTACCSLAKIFATHSEVCRIVFPILVPQKCCHISVT